MYLGILILFIWVGTVDGFGMQCGLIRSTIDTDKGSCNQFLTWHKRNEYGFLLTLLDLIVFLSPDLQYLVNNDCKSNYGFAIELVLVIHLEILYFIYLFGIINLWSVV